MESWSARLGAALVPPEAVSSPAVFAEQVRLLHANLPTSLGVGTIVAVVFLFALQAWHPAPVLWAWGGVLLLITLARAAALIGYRRADDPDVGRAYRRFTLGLVGAGLWWGGSGLLFFLPGVSPNQLLIALVLAGISSGAIGTLGPRFELAAGFVSLCLLPFALALLTVGAGGMEFLLILVVLFYLGMVMIALNGARTLAEVLRLRRERDHYVESLRDLHAVTADDTTVMPTKVDRMLDLALQVFGMQGATVVRVAGEMLMIEHARGRDAQAMQGALIPVNETPCLDTMLGGRPRFVVTPDTSGQRGFDARFRPVTYLGCPLSVGGRVWGTVSLTSDRVMPPITPDQMSLMNLFAQWIGAELAREQAMSALVSEKTRFEALFNALPDPLVVTDASLRITTVNPAFERVFGYSGPEVIGGTPRMLFKDPGQFEVAAKQLRESWRGESRRVVEVTLLDKQDRTVEVELNARPVRGPGHVTDAVLVHAHDVTERKRVARMKDQFVSTVSHELRTPLTAINGAIKLINATQRTGLNETALGLLEIADRNGERLLRLVNDILDLERAAAGRLKLQLTELRIADVLDATLRAIQPFAQDLRVALEIHGDPAAWVRADAQRLEQVLLNLLSNAVKFSPEGGVVRLEISSAPERVRLVVADEGPGIPVEFEPRVFEHFAQSADGSARRQGGSGLGLSIAKALTEQMGGSIGFESTPGKGSRFFIELVRVPPRGIALDPAAGQDGAAFH